MSKSIKVAAAVLAWTLGATAAHAQGLGGDETNVDRVVTSNTAWTVLVAEPFQLVGDNTSCIATGSADALNPNAGNNRQYRFTLAIDAVPAVDGPFERTVEFDANVTAREEVSSTAIFRQLPAGNHTIYWLARRIGGGSPNLIVTDNSMTFVCMNALLDPFDGYGDGY